MELSVKCHSLAHFDRSCNSFIVFYTEEPGQIPGSVTYKEQGRTEMVKMDVNPGFITTFNVSYSFEKQQRYRFDVYLGESKADTKFLTRHVQLGFAYFNIHELVCSPSQNLTKKIKSSKWTDNGQITVTAEEVSKLHHKVKMNWRLDNSTLKGPLILRVCRTLNKERVPVFQSPAQPHRRCCTF
jgi:hypothetical protein